MLKIANIIYALFYTTEIEIECAIAQNSPITDFEDAIQVACAERSGIGYIITKDSAFLQQCAIAIASAAFIKKGVVNS